MSVDIADGIETAFRVEPAVEPGDVPVGPGASAPIVPPIRRAGRLLMLVRFVAGLLPASRPKNRLLGLGRGSFVAPTARVAPIVLWQVGSVRIAEHASIGAFTAFRSLRLLQLDEGAQIGLLNWFSAGRTGMRQADATLAGSLVMGSNSGITNRHYVDCTGGLRLGVAVLVAGVRSTILTHSLDPRRWTQGAQPVTLGDSSVLYTNVVITAGRTVARDCLVAAGAVVTKDLAMPGRMYGGVPAGVIADMSSAACVGRTSSRDVESEAAHRAAMRVHARRALRARARRSGS